MESKMKSNSQPTEELKVAAKLFENERYDEALAKYHALADRESVTAQLFLGWMYHAGKGVQKNLEQAERWYRRAANSQSAEAQFYLGALYRAKGQVKEVFEWLEKSASQGYSPALYLLGQLYFVGEGVEINRDKAFQYFERAAQNGHLFAQRNIAYEMIKGRRGIARIPVGVLLAIRGLLQVIKVTVKDPDSDTIRRL
jgi:TPR repeat protein